jgi:hypothetical protein
MKQLNWRICKKFQVSGLKFQVSAELQTLNIKHQTLNFKLMSYTMRSHIIFGKTERREEVNVYKVTSVTIVSSWKQLTDTADIVLARGVNVFEKYPLHDLFRVGDPVLIRLGYNDDLRDEFTGYLSDISEGVPITLRCENEMFHLKNKTISISRENIQLRELLSDIAPGYMIDCPDGVELGSVRYANVSPAKILDDIREQTGLHSYFDGKTICCGVIYGNKSDVKPVSIHIEKQAVSENLKRKGTGEMNVRVRAISLLKGGKKIQVEAGDKNGTLNTLTYVGIEAKVELEKAATRDLERLKKRGFDGSVELFGIPAMRHGVKTDLSSDLYENLNGVYYVDKVTKTFDDSPKYHQTIEIGDRE